MCEPLLGFQLRKPGTDDSKCSPHELKRILVSRVYDIYSSTMQLEADTLSARFVRPGGTWTAKLPNDAMQLRSPMLSHLQVVFFGSSEQNRVCD